MPIIILTATAFEQQKLRDRLDQPVQQEVAHKTWTRGILYQTPVILIETGIGLVNTTQALTVALQNINPTLIIQSGIGGAYLQANLNIGDIVIATEENYAELGVTTPQGWLPANEMGIPVLKTNREYFNTYPCDTTLVEDATRALDQSQDAVTTGPFVTVQQCSGQTSVGNTLAQRFNAICENMEGVAATQICTQYNVPFLELRAISNQVEDRNRDAWNIPLSLDRSQTATAKLVQALS